jgi:outer membrane protein TolC
VAVVLMFPPALACQGDATAIPTQPAVAAYRTRMVAQETPAEPEPPRSSLAEPVATQDGRNPRRSLLVTPTTQPSSQPGLADVLERIPDPNEARRVFNERLETVKRQTLDDQRVVTAYRRTVDYTLELLDNLHRPTQIELGLADCVRRALVNNYAIRIASYNPAISQTQIVEAEAAFDAVFFLDTSWANTDRPTASELASNQSDTRSISGGLRQLLPTGATVSTQLQQQRTYTDLQFATLNPAYTTDFVTTITQPLLRGFGLDITRSQLLVARANYEISREQFIRQVRDTIFEVERAYWSLMQARRNATIQAFITAQNYVTYDSLQRRLIQNASQVDVTNAESRWKSRLVTYGEAVRAVLDAEDVLKNLLNDPQPELLLSQDVELVTSELPTILPFAIDQLAEVRTAIDMRSEVREAKLTIERARVGTAVAKNQTLPQLDLAFSYDVGGVGRSGDSSFDNATTNRFRSFTVGAQFSWAIGNRAPRAAYRRAEMQERQSILALNQATDRIAQEVNTAVRALAVRYSQIPTQYEASIAAEASLRAIQVRAGTITPTFLEQELNTVERLSNELTRLLQVIIDYNVAIVALEQAKGTLLEYNNVVLADEARR